MKKVAKYSWISVVVLLSATAVFTFLMPRFGWRIDAVMSGSMEPQLKIGALVITRPADTGEIIKGDIITFYSPLKKETITHRVVEIKNGTSPYFRTKGDANEDTDPFVVPIQNVAGRVYGQLPFIGYITQLLKSRPGILLTLGIPGLIIIAIEIKNILRVIQSWQSLKAIPKTEK